MKLRSLKVHGFKSFADSTTIDFHEGITAIVGPNGCGKSNISDAIRWVLGEQRPTAIRGAKMEEAIFQGTTHRRPVSRGAVTMVVGNEDNSLPLPFEEVEIGRTVYRDGGSDYSLNRSTCRLRDIHDLCRDTGLGANAYAVIENRMIDAILSDRAEERRGLFEEASGIGKYKDRRKSAMRRLEHAETDLQRLEDVIAEVETKVRSLARQKGKAERHRQLRERRLGVEVAVVRNDLDALRTRVQELDKVLSGDAIDREGMQAELRTAETGYESLRLREADLQRERAESAATLEKVREELVRWERELAVAGERRIAAERRLEQIDADRSSHAARLERVDSEAETLGAERSRLDADLEAARMELKNSQDVTASAKNKLDDSRGGVEQAETRARKLAMRGAQLEGDAAAADAQADELDRRIQALKGALEDASEALSDVEEQGDLFSGRVDELTGSFDEALRTMDVCNAAFAAAGSRLQSERGAHAAAEAFVQRISAEIEGLQAIEAGSDGMDPVLGALAELGDEGVVGPLLDAVESSGDLGSAVESLLGLVAKAVIVRDSAAVARITTWFREEWRGGGGLILLSLDGVPSKKGRKGSLLEAVELSGEGAGWAEALLWGVDLVEGSEVAQPAAGSRVTHAGDVVGLGSMYRIGNPAGTAGRLERRERLEALAGQLDQARAIVEEAAAARAAAETDLGEAEEALRAAREALQGAEDDLRAASAEVHAQVDRKSRLDSHYDDVVRQLEGTKATRGRVLERAEQAREDRQALQAEGEVVRRARQTAIDGLDAFQAAWESARDQESLMQVRAARLEGEVERLDLRVADLDREAQDSRGRLTQLEVEKKSLGDELSEITRVQEEGAAATEGLFASRDLASGDLSSKDEALRALTEELRQAEAHLREVRSAERAATDRRHRLELERQDASNKIGLIQERLEGEWGRPLDRLLAEAMPVEGEAEELRAELEQIVTQLERIGLVNMLAVEEHEEESARLTFLKEQREDLVKARDDLRTAIREINETAIGLFESTFEGIRENFRQTFIRLFEGGEADIWLSDPEDPLESPIEIHASPRGKKTQRIDLLSGGERALTALSLLFGIYLVKPSPFCVLDEVDAPLDENNIGRFIRLLQEFKHQSQFVVITHNPRTIEAADWIYGVTMEEPGVSKIVGVQLGDALQASGSAA